MSNNFIPPPFAERLIKWFCNEEWVDELLGDLEEQYQDSRIRNKKWISNIRYWWEVVRLLRPHIIRTRQKHKTIMMTFNHIKISYRNLIRNKVYAFINILGLSIGLASVILIGIYVNFETSYDKFFENSDRIYRVALHRIYPGRTKDFGTSAVRVAPVLNENYPQVELATRLHRLYFQNEITVTFEENDKSFVETRYLFADSLIFKVFSYKFIHGNPETAIKGDEAIVLTRSTAIKYYGTDDVLGKTFNANGGPLTITGIIEDIPPNSHIHFDLLGNTHSLGFLQNAEENDNWVSPWVNTYVKLRAGVNPEEFESGFDQMVETYGNAQLSTSIGSDWLEKGHKFEYFLQPIKDIHLKSRTDVEVEPNSDIAYVYVLTAIAFIILIISSINFINLSIARSTERAKEVGIRKVMGSHRRNLVSQFLTESVFICTLSSLISIVLLYLFIPKFNELIGTHLNFNVFAEPLALAMMVGAIFLIGLLSGLYPALSISIMDPSVVLKGSYKTSSKGVWLRNSLITFQFLISIVMISGSIIAWQQMNYLQNKDLGFDKENILVIKQSFNLGENYQSFKNDLQAMSGVVAVGGANYLPGDFHGSNVFQISNPDIADIRSNIAVVDDDFFDAIGFTLLSGRKFQREFNDSLSIIINEAAVKAMGVTTEEALNLKYGANNNNQTNQPPTFSSIIGVVKDYNYYSLHSEIGPLVLLNGNSQFTAGSTVVRVNTPDISGLISNLESKWNEMSEQPFNFSFLDQDLQRQYKADQNTTLIFNIFTYIAIIMSCTGLFGLATYIVNQRSKEMSVRKVLGASLLHIIGVFSKDFMILIGVAFLIGAPMAYFALNKWLENFAYHVNVGVLVFLLAGAVTIFLVFITVSYQAIKIARINPVKMLRSE